jgi:mRNA-degrading endonuclease RelE of RelBE toxin-antitoxin system
LSKKYPSLRDDFRNFLKALKSLLPGAVPGTVRISNLGHKVNFPVFKVKHFRSSVCRGKGVHSGFRIIYTYIQKKEKIVFFEIYHKNKKKNHDEKRIKTYAKEDLF